MVQSNYANLPSFEVSKLFPKSYGIKKKIDCCLMDLGLSQFQINSDRGFSYMAED